MNRFNYVRETFLAEGGMAAHPAGEYVKFEEAAAEIERLKDNVSEVTTYRDNAIKKIERLRNELTGTEKERDQLKARCDELEKALHLAKPIVLHEKEKLLKMEAAFPKGFDSSEAVKAFEALDSTLPKPAGSEQ